MGTWLALAGCRWRGVVEGELQAVLKGKKIAAHFWRAANDIEFEAGEFKVAGTDRKKTFADIALAAYALHDYPLEVLEPGLEE